MAAEGNVPIPDPTALTTSALAREILALRELLETRLNGTDALNEERFKGIQTEFGLRDARSEGQARESKLAVDAAFAAAKEANSEQAHTSKEAVDKSSRAIEKQIDGLVMLISTNTKSLDEKVDDLKQRVTRIEGKDTGISASWGVLVGAVVLIASLIAVGSFIWAGRQPVGYAPEPAKAATK